MDALLPIILQAITGIIGGQAVGSALKQVAMSQLPKILSGVIGGVAGGSILSALGGDAGALGGMLGDAVGGVGGGAILTAIVGAVMKSSKSA